MTTADGTKNNVVEIVDFPILVESCCKVIKALVVPSIRQYFILESDFENTFKVPVVFNHSRWNIQSYVSDSEISIISNTVQVVVCFQFRFVGRGTKASG